MTLTGHIGRSRVDRKKLDDTYYTWGYLRIPDRGSLKHWKHFQWPAYDWSASAFVLFWAMDTTLNLAKFSVRSAKILRNRSAVLSIVPWQMSKQGLWIGSYLLVLGSYLIWWVLIEITNQDARTKTGEFGYWIWVHSWGSGQLTLVCPIRASSTISSPVGVSKVLPQLFLSGETKVYVDQNLCSQKMDGLWWFRSDHSYYIFPLCMCVFREASLLSRANW